MATMKGSHEEDWIKVKLLQFIQFSLTIADHRSEPVHRARFCTTRSSSHSVAARGGCTTIPHSAGRAREDGTILNYGCSGHTLTAVRPPGSAKADQALVEVMRVLCAGRIKQPSELLPQ